MLRGRSGTLVLGTAAVLCTLASAGPGLLGGPTTRGAALGIGGLSLVAVLGFVVGGNHGREDGGDAGDEDAETDGGNDIGQLVEKIRQVEAGERDVEFSTDRDGEVGRLYDAVGDLADSLVGQERQFANGEHPRRELARIATAPDTSTDEKIERLLAFGCEHLGTENGHVVTVDRETGRYDVVASAGTDLASEGVVPDHRRPVYESILEADGPLVVPEVDGAADADTDDGDERIHCYVGARLLVGDDLYGAVCFASHDALEAPPGQREATFADLVARWLSQLVERQEHTAMLRHKDRALAAAPVGVVIADATHPDEPVVYVNEAFEEITGYDADEFLGRNCRFLQGPETDREPVVRMREAIDEGRPVSVELQNYRADGSTFWNHVRISPVTDENGDLTHLVGFQEDVTEKRERRRRLRQTSERLGAIVESSPAAIVSLDADDRVTLWNPAAERIFGWSEADVLGEPLPTVSDELADDHRQIYESLLDGQYLSGVETKRQTSDGTLVDVSLSGGPIYGSDGDAVGTVAVIEDITDRKERERELERTTELLGQAQHIAEVGGWELDLETEEMTVTDEFRDLHGLDPEEAVRLDDVFSYYHPDDVDYVVETFETAIEQQECYDMEIRLRTADGDTRWLRALGEPIVTDGEVTALRGSVQDITDAKDREQALQVLHRMAEDLLQTENKRSVAETVVQAADDLLDVAGICLFALDAESSRLVPEACTEAFSTTSDVQPVAVGDEDDPIWNSFATGRRRVLDAGDVTVGLFEDSGEGALVVPIGDHGVLAVAAWEAGVSARTRRLLETLVATAEAAFGRLESEAAVRERDEALAARNSRLRRQIQLTDVIRRVDQSLIGADSRDAVETAVVEELVSAEDVAFAWIGGTDASGEELVPRAWAGSGESYLDSVSLVLDGGSTEPALEATRTGAPAVVTNVVADLRGGSWRKPALDSGFTSVLAVPIALEEYRRGVLVVYADEPDVFGDLEREVFTELGQTVASALDAAQAREALLADTLLELRLSIDAPDTFLAQVARMAGCELEYVGTSAQSAAGTRLFFATDREVDEVLAELVSVSEFRLLSEAEDRWVYEAVVSGDALPSKLLRHGASPESIEATPAGLSLLVYVPTGAAVREFVEMLRDSYRSVELDGRRDVERPTRTRQQVVDSLLAKLTDRQREVLQTAYYAGFFDWPRGVTGEELAEMLDVSQPTVSRHLRLSQHQLFAELFEEELVNTSL